MRQSPLFPSDVRVSDSAAPSGVTLKVRTHPLLASTEMVPMVDAFVRAANFGMFSLDPRMGTNSMVVDSIESADDRTTRFLWTVSGMQFSAYRVLLNMLEATESISKSISRLQLYCAPGPGRGLSRDDLLISPFPMRAATPPFEITANRDLDDCREPVIRVVFANDLSDGDVAQLSSPFLAWDSIVVRGGYLSDRESEFADLDVEAGLASQQTYLAAPDTLEHLLYEFIGEAAAFDALVNMVTRIHCTFRSVIALEIE